MARTRRSLRFWAVWCAGFALAFAVALVLLARDDVVVCRNDLRTVAEPAGWDAWPVLHGLGGFHIRSDPGACVGHGLQCGLINTELRTADLCPRSGVSLDNWFDGDLYQSPHDIRLRESHGTFVATVRKDAGMPALGDEKFLVAFRRHTGSARPVFKDLPDMVACLCLLGLLVAIAAAAYTARRLLRRRRDYRDPRRYAPGRRDHTGTVVFEDGTRPLVAPGAPGPVLVRLAPATDGGYRVAASAAAAAIIEGDLPILCAQLEERATGILRWAGRLALLAVVAPLAVSIFLFVGEVLAIGP